MATPVEVVIKARDAFSGVFNSFRKDFGSVVRSVLSLPTAIAGSLAAVTLGAFFKKAIGEATEAALGIERLGVAVTNAGADFAKVQPQIDATVESLRQSTRFKDDELVAGLEQLITTSGNVQGSIASLSLVTDLAAQKKMSLADAAEVVGKVMVGETGGLKRLGIVLRDDADAMAELQRKFGGFAATEGQRGGILTRISNAWDSLAQRVGKAIITTDAYREGTSGLVRGLASVEQWIGANTGVIEDMTRAAFEAATTIGTTLVESLKNLGPVLNVVSGGFLWLTEQIQNFTGETSIRRMEEALQKVAQSGFANAGPGTQAAGRSAFAEFQNRLGIPGSAAQQDAIRQLEAALRRLDDTELAHLKVSLDVFRRDAEASGKWSVAHQQNYSRVIGVINQAITKKREEATTPAGTPGTLGGPLPSVVSKAQWEKAKDEIDRQAKEGNKAFKAALKEAQDFHQRYTALVQRATETAIDALKREFNALIAIATQQEDVEAVSVLTGLRDQAVGAATAIQDAEQLLKEIAAGRAGDPFGEQFWTLGDQLEKLTAQLATLKAGTEDYARVEDALRAIEAKRRDILKDLFTLPKVDTTAQDALETLQQQAYVLQQSVQGALQLGQALGLVDESAAKALTSIAQIAANLPVAAAAGVSFAARLPGILGVAGGIASFAGGIFAESPDEKAARDAAIKSAREAADALGELARNAGDLARMTASGAELGGARTALQAAIAGNRPVTGAFGTVSFPVASPGMLQQELAKVGLTWKELQQIAAGFGITLGEVTDNVQESIKGLAQALAEADFKAFTDTFAGQMERLNIQFRLFGVTDAQEKFRGLIEVLTDPKVGAPALFGALAGLDLGAAGGIGAARTAIQSLFTQATQGELTPEQMGGLNLQQFLAALQELMGFLDEAAGSVHTLSGALATLQNDFAVFGTTDPIAQLQQTLATMGEFSPALAALASGLDLTTEQGLNAFAEQLQALYSAVKAGGAGLDLGTLSIEELLQAILQLASGASAAAGIVQKAFGEGQAYQPPPSERGMAALAEELALVTAGAGGVTDVTAAAFQALTTVQGDRLLDFTKGILAAVQSSALSNQLVAEYFGGRPTVPTTPAGRGLEASVRVGPINIDVIAQGADPRQFGVQIGDAIIREINMRLGQGTLLAELFRGQVGRG